ncbi:hypothetical protein Stsp01_66670 [Streptomyces sp. NBRC 13847]|nr:hypothetical protein Stsp01_66670 [Streptomyces sp. NBRC 13847]
MNRGSVESLNVCDRCGAGAKARQIREMADWDMPVAAAMDLVDQWVRTMSAVTPSRRATSMIECPSADSRTTLERSARAWAVERRRT